MNRIGLRELILVAISTVFVLAWILSAIGAAFYAARLKRSGAWGLLSLVVSPLPVFLLLFGLGPREEDDYDHISCPFCAEEIKSEARLCPHCRSELTRASTDRLRPR
jgi:hypothetical protein